MNLFNEVKERVNAADVAGFYGLQINRSKMACCPFHDDKHPSMKINQTYYCFACGEKGDAINYVAKMFGISQFEAAKKIVADMNLPIQWKKSGRIKKPPACVKKKKEKEEAQVEAIKKKFHQWCIDTTHKLLDSINLIQTTKEYLKDKNPELVMNSEAYATLLHMEPIINYWLDILCFGTEQEKEEFFLQRYKEVTELEQTIFRAGKTILDTNWGSVEQRKCG